MSQAKSSERNQFVKRVFLAMSGLSMILVFFFSDHSPAGIFGSSVPEGKEIKAPYLEQLFAPEYPYEWVKIIDTKEGERFVVIKAKQKITKDMEYDYQTKTLRGRNIAIQRVRSPRDDALVIGKIRLSRKVSDKPYVIEYCQADQVGKPKPKNDIAWRDDKYFVLWVDSSFGKQFKKLVIYPEKEAECPPPPFVGKYPESVTVGCVTQTFDRDSYPYKKGQGRIIFTYVTKDQPEKIYNFYRDKLLKQFDDIGISYPEENWKIFGTGDQLGIQIRYMGIEVVDEILTAATDRGVLHGQLLSTSLKGKLPPKGVIFNTVIFPGVSAEPLIKDYSWIEIQYDYEPNVINARIKKFGKDRPK